jgi:hypothetical protein
MPARGDYYWRKSDSHPVGWLHPYLARQAAPQAAAATAIGGIIGDLVRGQ